MQKSVAHPVEAPSAGFSSSLCLMCGIVIFMCLSKAFSRIVLKATLFWAFVAPYRCLDRVSLWEWWWPVGGMGGESRKGPKGTLICVH